MYLDCALSISRRYSSIVFECTIGSLELAFPVHIPRFLEQVVLGYLAIGQLLRFLVCWAVTKGNPRTGQAHCHPAFRNPLTGLPLGLSCLCSFVGFSPRKVVLPSVLVCKVRA